MKKKGKHVWAPPEVLNEIENIKKSDDIFSQAEAFRKLITNAQIGKELKNRRGLK